MMKTMPIALASLALLAGCAHLDPGRLAPGTPQADVLARLGPPTARHAAPQGGQRLEYASGPYGRTTWMLDFDAGGSLRGAEQVLTEKRFHDIRAGMSADEVRTAIGRPSEVWQVGWAQRQSVWSYRYETPFCQWFMVGVDPSTQRVVDTAHGPDPMCDKDNDF